MTSKSSASTKEKLIDDEEDVLQAVILADSFNKRFRPLTTQKPRVRDKKSKSFLMFNTAYRSAYFRYAMRLC